MALILSGLASMPLVETKQPSTLPRVTAKTHFFGFSLSLASRILVKIFIRTEIYDAFFFSHHDHAIDVREHIFAHLVF
jgi:hypothetical protein